MKKLALTTCNDDPRYYRWIPYAIDFWNKLGFDFIVHFYGKDLPKVLQKFNENIIIESHEKRLTTSSVCQISRLFLPSLHLSYDHVLITDVDLLPLSQPYFNMVNRFPKDKFVAMRKKEKEFYMGFNCASPNLWQELTKVEPTRTGIRQAIFDIFKANSKLGFREFLGIRPMRVHWGLDQKLLSIYYDALSDDKKICISGLNDLYTLQSGLIAKLAYFESKGKNVDYKWIEDNKSKIIFFTRDESREMSKFEEEIEFLSGVYSA